MDVEVKNGSLWNIAPSHNHNGTERTTGGGLRVEARALVIRDTATLVLRHGWWRCGALLPYGEAWLAGSEWGTGGRELENREWGRKSPEQGMRVWFPWFMIWLQRRKSREEKGVTLFTERRVRPFFLEERN